MDKKKEFILYTIAFLVIIFLLSLVLPCQMIFVSKNSYITLGVKEGIIILFAVIIIFIYNTKIKKSLNIITPVIDKIAYLNKKNKTDEEKTQIIFDDSSLEEYENIKKNYSKMMTLSSAIITAYILRILIVLVLKNL